jgi:ribonuclease D
MTEVQEPVEPESVLLDKPRLETLLIEDETSLQALVRELKETSNPVALDAERASGFRYGQRAYLLQVAIEGKAIY